MRDRDGFLWLVVAAEPSRERFAREHLEDAGFKVLWPHYVAESSRARKVTTTALRSYFPPVMFVAIGSEWPADGLREIEDVWFGPVAQIKSTRRVKAVMWGQGPHEPHWLSPGWLRKRLKPRLLNAEGLMEPPDPQVLRARYQPGQIVQMRGGPFAGFLATVIADYGTSVDVEHELFGRPAGRQSYDPDAVELPVVIEGRRTTTH